MNIRDYGTSWYLELQRIKIRIEMLGDCADRDEILADSYELVADLQEVMTELDTQLELGMDEE